MRWIDAHNHLHHARLAPFRERILADLEKGGIAAAVVNGTQEQDWEAVAILAAERPWVRPAFGLHPWYVQGRSAHWQERLTALLDSHRNVSIGEVGLDRWIQGFDVKVQQQVLAAQLALAKKRNLPVTVHCLKAWGALEEMTRAEAMPECGWLLHSYGGSREMMEELAKRGAYFSFSGYFLHERKAASKAVFREIALERLLVETDAPDMPPPNGADVQILEEKGCGSPLNSPMNIELCYRKLAEFRGMKVEELVQQVEANFLRLFGAS